MPAPYLLRQIRADEMRSDVDSAIEPIGAPNPLEKQTLMVSAYFPYSLNATPDAT